MGGSELHGVASLKPMWVLKPLRYFMGSSLPSYLGILGSMKWLRTGAFLIFWENNRLSSLSSRSQTSEVLQNHLLPQLESIEAIETALLNFLLSSHFSLFSSGGLTLLCSFILYSKSKFHVLPISRRMRTSGLPIPRLPWTY